MQGHQPQKRAKQKTDPSGLSPVLCTTTGWSPYGRELFPSCPAKLEAAKAAPGALHAIVKQQIYQFGILQWRTSHLGQRRCRRRGQPIDVNDIQVACGICLDVYADGIQFTQGDKDCARLATRK